MLISYSVVTFAKNGHPLTREGHLFIFGRNGQSFSLDPSGHSAILPKIGQSALVDSPDAQVALFLKGQADGAAAAPTWLY